MNLNDCRPRDGHCARYPAIRIHDSGVCQRCRLTGGRSMDQAAHPPPPGRHGPTDCAHRGDHIGWRPCATCAGRVRLKVYGCRLRQEGVTLIDCQTCEGWREISSITEAP